MTKTTADYFNVGLSEDKHKVKLTILNEDGAYSAINLTQEEAFTIAGQIQGFALQIRKP